MISKVPKAAGVDGALVAKAEEAMEVATEVAMEVAMEVVAL